VVAAKKAETPPCRLFILMARAASPDGELLLYFALQGSRWQTSYRGSWTAVSRVPWLHALALWPQGDTWGGWRPTDSEGAPAP
jgi:hypothetical protein